MKTLKILLNRLILLIFLCAVTSGTLLLLALIRSKPVVLDDFYTPLLIGAILWIINIISGRIRNWPFKES